MKIKTEFCKDIWNYTIGFAYVPYPSKKKFKFHLWDYVFTITLDTYNVET